MGLDSAWEFDAETRHAVASRELRGSTRRNNGTRAQERGRLKSELEATTLGRARTGEGAGTNRRGDSASREELERAIAEERVLAREKKVCAVSRTGTGVRREHRAPGSLQRRPTQRAGHGGRSERVEIRAPRTVQWPGEHGWARA